MPRAAAVPTFTLEPYSYADARALVAELGLAEPVAVTLVRRGHDTPAAARAFLEAGEEHDPFAFAAMAGVVARLRAAAATGERLTVHGDYDVDGVCATAIVVAALREIGAQCDWHIPGRLEDGYGLSPEGVARLAARGTRVLVTVDCGIGSPEAVAAARDAGLDVIVTDHHQPGETLPDCPILHPALSGYPCPDLCATGVAHKLGEALIGAERAERHLDLVALATIADMVPLQGENRSLVRRGLEAARLARRPGLRALMAVASVEPSQLDEGALGFRLGPRINAAGRLYRADVAVELMLTDDPGRAAAIAAELDRANHERRAAEREVLAAAERARAELPAELAEAPALVLAGQGWHPGVVGIVASRMAERHCVPTVLIGLDGDSGRGSGRSVAGFDLLAALRACESRLVRYGGHRAAAGLEIAAAEVAAFREAFAAHASAALGSEAPGPCEAIDAVVGGESLGLDVAEQLARLGPFGMGNPDVRLLVPAARVRDIRPMGEGERHARFVLESGARRALGVAFGVNGELRAAAEGPLDASVRLELNHWNGAVEPRVVLGSLYPAAGADDGGGTDEAVISAAEWWRRLDAEREASLDDWPPASLAQRSRPAREVVERLGGSGVATVAALASSGEPVLVLCADAARRRDLVERAAVPRRFGGGEVALVCGRLADDCGREALERLRSGGAGVALADWAALTRAPALCRGFTHVVLVDPPPFAHLEALAASGEGFVHLGWGDAEAAFALQVHAQEWPQRPALAALYRRLAALGGDAPADECRAAIRGSGPHPPSPEACARLMRVLEELGVARLHGSGPDRLAGVVSSQEADLERSRAFAGYRSRYEEGARYLTRPRQPS